MTLKKREENRRWKKTEGGRASARKSTKKWREANPEKTRKMKREQIKRYRAKYPEKVAEQRKVYRATHPDYWRASRERNAEKIKLSRLKTCRERRAALIDLLGGACVGCGATTKLDLDHRLPRLKAFKLSGSGLGRAWETVVAEAKKCDLRCRPCHNKKSALEKAGQRAVKMLMMAA